ncbi:MAG: hypothetical protein J0I17_02580 ['Candidatus Kapabacteria' thiocyanatum]|uniref:AB hydrolase-1 domain-containing protein n=1 Tax=Candidatus Kapaibacterium thiocyanatum TaxID=1895771 RepID=A0A1M3KX61_9BACT|nr:hypothetical protein ['Candidatus Kapabacteria' thiocyanatum]OJX57051.1 MAG: hypothetical protein BGO89_11110 ['Candidatus Kapabacteria' thiocyanatum]
MTIAERTITIPNGDGRDLHATITRSTGERPMDLVLLLHGFKGFRNWGFFPVTAQHLADAGFVTVRMDFSGNGMNGGADRVVDLDAFARNTISAEVHDAHTMIAHLRAMADQLGWNGRLHIVGHSRGGGIAHVVGRELIEGNKSPDTTLSRCVVWNSVGTWQRWTPRQRAAWQDAGFVEMENARTGQKLRMDVSYAEDIERASDRLDLVRASGVLADGMLYIHADQDITVPLKEVKALRSRSGTSAPLYVVPNTTHTFGMTHPLDHITPALVEVLETTTSWLRS